MSDQYFGMHVPGSDTAWPDAKVGAVNLTTNLVYWPQLEPTEGTFDWTRLDALVAQARAYGARPLLVLGQTPSYASTSPTTANVAGTVPTMAAWKTFVSAVAERYKTRIDYEIWPEPNAASNWLGTQEQLAALAVAAAQIIHGAAPKAVVVSPAMVVRYPFQMRELATFLQLKVGGRKVGSYFDAIGVDAYPRATGSPEDSATLIKTVHHILNVNRLKAPIWNVEINYGVAGDHASVPSYSATKQASYVTRTFLLNAANGVKRVYWLGWAHIDEVGIQMVQSNQVTLTAAGKAYIMVRSWMTGQTVPACTYTRSKHLYTCKMVKRGHASWVYWTTKGTVRVPAARGTRHVQHMLKNPAKAHAGQRIVVTTSPVRAYH